MEDIYIGTKIIAAEPMTENTFRREIQGLKSFIMPDREGFKVRYRDGYISWSPREEFEAAYRKISDGERQMVTLDGVKSHVSQVFSEENIPEDMGTK